MNDQPSSGIQVSPKLLAASIVTVLAVVFVAQNREESRIDFLWMHLELGLWLALAATFLLGAMVGWLVNRSRSN